MPTPPPRFFELFVLRAYKDWLASPADQYLAKMAVTQADVMAERVWDYFHASDPSMISNAKSARAFRTHLVANECPNFQLVWDVHDAHKHVHLTTRSDRQVSSSEQTRKSRIGGALGSAPFGAAPIGSSIEEIVISLDDGTSRRLSTVLNDVIAMWDRIVRTM